MEALSGYLMIAERLLEGRDEFAAGWNFGPSEEDAKPVGWIVERMLEMWGADGWDRPEGEQPHEATLLKLDCSKARAALGWRPRFSLEKALEKVVEWHKSIADGADAREVSLRQLREYSGLGNIGAGEVTA
jgi:CDP-glucose 4,6-dehydratase